MSLVVETGGSEMGRRVALVACLAGLVVAMSASAASAQSNTFTETVRGFTETFAEVNPCTGDPGQVTVTYNAVFHITEDPDGGFHVTGTLTGTFTFVPDDSSLPTYTGRFTNWFGGNVSSNSEGFWETFRVNGTGSDGSTLVFNAVEQIHFSNGELHVEFSLANCL
jgi:hypothetical protein